MSESPSFTRDLHETYVVRDWSLDLTREEIRTSMNPTKPIFRMSNQESGVQQVEEIALASSHSPVSSAASNRPISVPSSPATAAAAGNLASSTGALLGSNSNNSGSSRNLVVKPVTSNQSLIGSVSSVNQSPGGGESLSGPRSPSSRTPRSDAPSSPSTVNSPRTSAPPSPRPPDGTLGAAGDHGKANNNNNRDNNRNNNNNNNNNRDNNNGRVASVERVSPSRRSPRQTAPPPPQDRSVPSPVSVVSAGPSKIDNRVVSEEDITTCVDSSEKVMPSTKAITTSPVGGGGGGGDPASLKSGGTDSAIGTNGEYKGCFRLRNVGKSGGGGKKNKLHSDSDDQDHDSDKGCKVDAKKCLFWCCCCACAFITAVKNDPNRPSKEKPQQVSPLDHFFAGDNEQPPTLEDIRTWGESFDKLMKCTAGRKIFRDFLKCEYSEENILFWLACEDLKAESNPDVIEEKARLIYEDYISILSPKEVSLDSRVREIINKNMVEPSPHTFDEAQLQIYTLMHRDSYPRFVNSPIYRKLAQLPSPSRKGSAA